MRQLFSTLRMDLPRAFNPFRCIGVILCIVVLNYVAIWHEYTVNEGNSVVYLYELFVLQGPFMLISIFLGCIPYSAAFCSDWKNRFIRSCIIRTTKGSYAWSKIISVALSSLVIVFIGHILTVILFSCHMPIVEETVIEDAYYTGGVYDPLLTIHPFLYLTTIILVFSTGCMFWSVFSLYISSCYPNVFVIYAAPILTYYFCINFITPHLPVFLRFNAIVNGTVDMGSPVFSLLYSILFHLILTVIFGLLFSRNVRRRLANG